LGEQQRQVLDPKPKFLRTGPLSFTIGCVFEYTEDASSEKFSYGTSHAGEALHEKVDGLFPE
jgi:hypothetical protein